MISELKELLAVWIAAVAAAVDGVMARLVRRRRIVLVQGEGPGFTARAGAAGKGADLPELSFQLRQGRPEPPLSAEWSAALRGSHLEIAMQPDQVLFRTVDFPRQAADFLDGMIRAQIDRLSPWTASDAAFGTTVPEVLANERIGMMLAVTSRHTVQPLLDLATHLGASTVAGLVAVPDCGPEVPKVTLFETSLGGAVGWTLDTRRLLRLGLLGAAMAAAVSLAVATYVGASLDSEQHELQQRIAQRRSALRISQAGGSAESLLATRKQTTPSSVMVLEAISRVLPDSTYVTELRVEGDKMQVVGLTQDAPALIRLIEQSPQFSRATFFAPTTRAQNDPGERFHIEAHITPYFGTDS